MFASQFVQADDLWAVKNSHLECSLCYKPCIDAVQLDCNHIVCMRHTETSKGIQCGTCNRLTQVKGVDFEGRRKDTLVHLEPIVKCMYKWCSFVGPYTIYITDHVGKACVPERQWHRTISVHKICLYCGVSGCSDNCREPTVCKHEDSSGRSCGVIHAKKHYKIHWKLTHSSPCKILLKTEDGKLSREFIYTDDGRIAAITREVIKDSGMHVFHLADLPNVNAMTWEIDTSSVYDLCKGKHFSPASDFFSLTLLEQYTIRFLLRNFPGRLQLDLRLVPVLENQKKCSFHHLSFVLDALFGSLEPGKPQPKQIAIKTKTLGQLLSHRGGQEPDKVDDLKITIIDKDDIEEAITAKENSIHFKLTMT